MAKKSIESKKNNDKVNLEENWLNKLFVSVGVICFLGLFYLLTLHITNKNSPTNNVSDDTSSDVSISYDEIILGRSLSIDDSEYLVICYDKSNDEISSIYSSLVSTYKSKEDHLNIYTVDMSSSFNKSYVTSDESNKSPSDVSDMLINGPTLMKVSEKKVVDYIEGENDITDYLS